MQNELRKSFKLDPWTASSLLQKAIRRSETPYAQFAAHALHRQRGNAIWRRLANIAVEDVGLADPALLWEVVSIAADKRLRQCLGADVQLLGMLVEKLAAAPKDRSTDYLICAATRLPEGHEEARYLVGLTFEEQVALAVDPSQSLLRRGLATLISCTGSADATGAIQTAALNTIIEAAEPACSEAVRESVKTFIRKGGHALALMLLPLSAAFSKDGASVVDTSVPQTEFLNGIPLYALDKHTALGKRAIARFATEIAEVRRVLSDWVPARHTLRVAEMAAFYADAVPIRRRLEWPLSGNLQFAGTTADMIFAGCHRDGIRPVLQCVEDNLHGLNELRRSAVARRHAAQFSLTWA